MWRPVFAQNTGELPNPQFQSSRLTAVALGDVLATVPELMAHRNNERNVAQRVRTHKSAPLRQQMFSSACRCHVRLSFLMRAPSSVCPAACTPELSNN